MTHSALLTIPRNHPRMLRISRARAFAALQAARTCGSVLVSSLYIDHVRHRLAALEARDSVEDHVH